MLKRVLFFLCVFSLLIITPLETKSQGLEFSNKNSNENGIWKL